jgi:ESX secretion system protein EccE
MTARIMLALLFIIPAAMAYPWPLTRDRWIHGVAVVAVVVLFAWWRGTFLTTVVGRRIAMLLRCNSKTKDRRSPESTTVLMRVDASEPTRLPLHLIAGYLDRYGIRCDKIRVTTRDVDGAGTTWIGLTFDAADNLPALQARSPRIPLHDTAEVVARRLADHLREAGWNVTPVDTADGPARHDAKETWRGLRDASGNLAAYRVESDLDAVRALPSSEIWTALEITGAATDLRVAAACAVRTDDKPLAIAGLTPLHGRHRPALDALSPVSVDRLTGT